MRHFTDAAQLGKLKLRNRIVMSPLTRCRAPGRIPTPLMAEYYRQRASAGLIIAEATAVTDMGVGYPDTPGIWSDAQVQSWKAVTKAVHDEGGTIVLQLWHVGRISDPEYLGGRESVAPSAIAAEGHVNLLRPLRPFPVPRALETEEIPQIVECYRKGAENAKKAGFDGVEIHCANGYLPDQFLEDNSNHRTDRYGGSLENRLRFPLECVDAAVSVWGPQRVGVHLSPRGEKHSMADSNREATFGAFARALGERRLAFLFIRDRFDGGKRMTPLLKEEFGGPVIANDGLSPAHAAGLLASGEVDAVAWGTLFISNPDLPARLFAGAPLATPDPDTFYYKGTGPVEKGYTDYPPLHP